MKKTLKVWIILAAAGLLLGLGLIFWPSGPPHPADGARPVEIWQLPTGEVQRLLSAAATPAEILAEAGIPLASQDRIYWSGMELTADALLPLTPLVLEWRPAVPVLVTQNDDTRTLSSSAATLGGALWEEGIVVDAADWLSLPLETTLTEPSAITLRRAVPLRIQVDGQEILIHSAAETVGQALAQAGIPLQGLDYSLPAEEAPLPTDGFVHLVRVQEEIVLNTIEIPFDNDYVPDPTLELDLRRVIAPGEPGLQVQRQRVRYEDGVEIQRTVEGEWIARQPRNAEVGYGTQVVIRSLATPAGTIEYWRAIQVYATSYRPCYPNGYCSYATAMGTTLHKGVVAVIHSWYNVMAGQSIYVPDYGVGRIEDWGLGIPGRDWIDLGFDETDFENWHWSVTMYFLTPVPDNIPWILP
ncbi:MAG TPA: ubiquitin-like domain-containing protein [Anaerolineaceae bacterium]|nr:ubiquitin-like domain-containing protein [Anaerolineaceae bacterium]